MRASAGHGLGRVTTQTHGEITLFHISVNKHSKAQQCLHGWVQGGNRCYLPVINQLTSWLGARMNCLALEADLVSINTAQEQVIVNRIMEVRA